MNNSKLDQAIQSIKSEIKVMPNGQGYASIRAVARLCGVTEKALRKNFNSADLNALRSSKSAGTKGFEGADLNEPVGEVQNRTKLAEILEKKGFEGAALKEFSKTGVPDIAIAIIVKYYAYKAGRYCTEQAEQCSDVFDAIGIRAWMQSVTGWQDPGQRRLTDEEIAELCIFTAGRQWQKRFDDVFYAHLSNVTGYQCDGNKRPKLFAALTNEFVYDRMPKGVSAKLRQCREETGGWKHLHRFLSEDGLQVFEKHMQNLLLLMAAASSVNQLRDMIRKVDAEAYQLQLFSDCRKDGKLTVFNHLKQG